MPKPTPSQIANVMRELGRRGGLKGGHARREALTPERRTEIASKAALARWSKSK